MVRDAILRGLTHGAIWHNATAIPRRSLDQFLAESCCNLAVLTGVEEFPLSLPGSATLIKYKESYFLVCTRHQVKGIAELSGVCIKAGHLEGETNFITSNGAIWTDQTLYESEYHELCVFDFTEPCRAYPILTPRFFEVREQHPKFREDWVLWATAYGFPSTHVDYDYENKRINARRLRVPCRFDSVGSDDAVHSLAILETLGISPDGMSGGPVFFVLEAAGMAARVHLAGVIVTGGNNNLRVIKAGAVLQMLDNMIEKRATR